LLPQPQPTTVAKQARAAVSGFSISNSHSVF